MSRIWPAAAAAVGAAVLAVGAFGSGGASATHVSIDGPGTPTSVILAPDAELASMSIHGTGKATPLSGEMVAGIRNIKADDGRTAHEREAASIGLIEVGKVVSWLEASHRDAYVTYRALRDVEGPLYELIFTEKPAADVVDKAAQVLPFEVIISYGAAGTDAELTEATGVLMRSLNEDLGRRAFTVGQNEYATGIEVAYNPKEVEGDRVLATLKAALPAWQQTYKGMGLSVLADVDVEVAQAEANVSGGRQMSSCTTGFTATRGSNEGVITAKHCGTSQGYLGASGVLTAGAAASDGGGGETDMRFFRTLAGSSALTRFYYNASSYWAPAYSMNPGSGAYTCVNGSATAFSSGVNCTHASSSVNGCQNFRWNDGTTHTHCGLVTTTTRITLPGDSGGPWFNGTIALGIHSGSGDGSMFTRIGRAANHLDATLLLN